jgi:hypothetical protein
MSVSFVGKSGVYEIVDLEDRAAYLNKTAGGDGGPQRCRRGGAGGRRTDSRRTCRSRRASNELARTLLDRFKRLGAIADLESAIRAAQEAVALPADGHVDRAAHVNTFAAALWIALNGSERWRTSKPPSRRRRKPLR